MSDKKYQATAVWKMAAINATYTEMENQRFSNHLLPPYAYTIACLDPAYRPGIEGVKIPQHK